MRAERHTYVCDGCGATFTEIYNPSVPTWTTAPPQCPSCTSKSVRQTGEEPLGAAPVTRSEFSTWNPGTRWEYASVSMSDDVDKALGVLNGQGYIGWELVAIYGGRAWLKRPRSDQ